MFKKQFVDYYSYIKSDKWKKKRLLRIKELGAKCRRCGSDKMVDVHHLTYARLGCEKGKDLTVLCRLCHSFYHSVYKKPTAGTTKMFIRNTSRKWDKLLAEKKLNLYWEKREKNLAGNYNEFEK